MAIRLGLDRETPFDLGSIPAPPASHVYLTGRNLDDWGVTYIQGGSIFYVDVNNTPVSYAIPGGATAAYVGGGIWKLTGSVNGVIEPSGVSSLAGDSGNLPIGNGGEWFIDFQSNSSNTDTRTDVTLMADVGFVLPPDQNGNPVNSVQTVPNGPQPVGQVTANSSITDNTASLLFAGFNCSIFETSSLTVTDDSVSDFLFLFAAEGVECTPLFGALNTVTSATQILAPLGTMICNQSVIRRFVDRDVNRTFSQPKILYNAETDSAISTTSHKALSFSPAEVPSLGSNTLAVNLVFPAAHVTTGIYDSRLDPQYSPGCRISSPNYGSMPPGLGSWVHPDLPDNDSDPNNINFWQTTFADACQIALTNGGNTSETIQTWNYSPHPEWDGFIGSRIKWCVANQSDPTLIDRYSGTITATDPAAQTAGSITETVGSSEAASIENDIPQQQTVTEITVNLTSVETVAFDWHFENGVSFYHEDSLLTIPSDPSTCQLIGNSNGSSCVIASAAAPTEVEGEVATNKFEKWLIDASGNISLVGNGEYNIYGMGSPDLDNTLAWDIGIV